MADTYGELISRLCKLRDQLKKTPEGRAVLREIEEKLLAMMQNESGG